MPSNSSEVQYELFEDKRAIKFMDKNADDDTLIRRIYIINQQLILIKKQKVHLKVENVLNVKKQEWEIQGYIFHQRINKGS